MSGIEAAGLVLAVFPLFISALEDYKEGLEPIRAFLDFNNQLPAQIHRLTCQHVQYQLTLSVLLSQIVDDRETLDEMLASPFGDSWNVVKEKLRGRLRESYSAYERTVGRMEELMKLLGKRMTIGEMKIVDLEELLANHPRRDGKFEFMRRVKFSMSKKKMKNLLDELDDCNRQLEGFTNKTGQLESFESSTKSQLSLSFTNKIRSFAASLYNVICETHTANTPLVWQDTRIKAITSDELEIARTLRNPGGRVARFAPPMPSVNPTLPVSVDFRTLQELQDICSIVRQPQTIQSCLGFCLDCQGKLRGVYPFEHHPKLHKDTISLAEILSSSSFQSALSLKERLILGAILASSYLQLQATPWLRSSWSKEDIIFNADRDTDTFRWFDAGSPCIAHTFQPEPPSSTTGDEMQGIESNVGPHQHPTSSKHRGNSSLLALGIILMELYTGKTLQQYCTATSLSSTPAAGCDEHLVNIHNLYAAHQWWAELKDRGQLSHAYMSAVNHCLQGYLDFSVKEDEADFRQKVLSHVVLPVEEEMQIFTGMAR
ncbi:hypothetical protein N431DRAFT_464877 [Stipitochalara longipes BDJ]|nr:hypothetical protein N431DRAFT_464877 [Stipitochalara longipes BDJ]